MLFRESLRTSLKELWANKVASLLNILAIVISITALNVMMAIMNGMERSMLIEMNQIGGLEKAIVRFEREDTSGKKLDKASRQFSLKDILHLKEELPYIRYATLQSEIFSSVQYRDKDKYNSIMGVTRDALWVKKYKLDEGRFISDEDLMRARQVCVIGSGIQQFYGNGRETLLGTSIAVQGKPYEVVGVLKPRTLIRNGSNVLSWENDVVFVPVTTFSAYAPEDRIDGEIHYMVRDPKDISRVRAAIEKMMRLRGRGAVKIDTAEAFFARSRKAMNRMKINFSLIAGISLVVGGIGIMNIMLASVASRIKEIGIRQSIGATPRDIMTQFLIESMTVSFLGGLVGIVISFMAVVGLGQFSKESPPYMGLESVLLSVIFSALVGLCFGIYPALKASKLDPIQALRYQ